MKMKIDRGVDVDRDCPYSVVFWLEDADDFLPPEELSKAWKEFGVDECSCALHYSSCPVFFASTEEAEEFISGVKKEIEKLVQEVKGRINFDWEWTETLDFGGEEK